MVALLILCASAVWVEALPDREKRQFGGGVMRRVSLAVMATVAVLAVGLGLASAAEKTTVLKAARMFDGKSGKIASPRVVVVTDGKIVAASAELLGWGDRIGTLEIGKIADVVAVPGNRVENVRVTEQVLFVMKEGVVYRHDRAGAK
jgi:hypothetical protein